MIFLKRIRSSAAKYFVTSVLVVSPVTAIPRADSAYAASCISPLGTDGASNAMIVDGAYQQWKSTYVTSSGAGGDLRVQRSSGDNHDTVSEGIAYGMLFAVYNNDKSTFDGLWAYAQKHLNSNGVMNWRIAADGSTTGYNGATDADQDMAAALVAADTTWGGYHSGAIKQINAVKQNQIEQGSSVVKPGDVWGGNNLLNPSYLAPSYYDLFQNYTGDNDWANVKTASYSVLKSAQNTRTGLIPDWSTSSGSQASGMSHDYSYDASRAPLRLALAAAWSCDGASFDLLRPFNDWFAGKNLSQLASSYTLDGTANGSGDSTPALAAATSAATVSKNDTYRSASWKALTEAPSTGYYPDSMRLFGLLVASGTMINPLDLPQRSSSATTTTTSAQIIGGNMSASTGKQADLSLSFVAPKQQNNLIIDIELYDKTGRKIAQNVYDNQTLSTTAKKYNLRWTPDATGEYTLKGGIFMADWAQNLTWNDHAATVIVSPPLSTIAVTAPPSPSPLLVPASTSSPTPDATISIWWPGSSQPVSGLQPFKVVLDGKNPGEYDMFWQVDGGRLNEMDSINDSVPHKESWVDVGNWNWSSNGHYTITFVAKNKSGVIITQKSVIITVAK